MTSDRDDAVGDGAPDQIELRLSRKTFAPPGNMLLPLFFCLNLPESLGSTHTFYNELDTGPLRSSPHKAPNWPSYPPPLPLWAIGPQSPYKPRRRFVPYFGLNWSSTTTSTTSTTTTERPYEPFSTCEHLPAYCSSYFSSNSTKPLPTQARQHCFKYNLAFSEGKSHKLERKYGILPELLNLNCFLVVLPSSFTNFLFSVHRRLCR